MKKEDLIFVQHIFDSIEKIEKFMQGINEENFYKDEQLQDAVIRRIEVIGEAVKNISASFRDKYPNIPWKGIAGMRDKIIHHYFGLDLDTIWDIIKEDISKLKKDVKDILEKENST